MSQPSSNDQEIDLGQLLGKIGNFFQSILDSFFDFYLFIKKNILIITALFLLGAGIGFFLDKETKSYSNEIIVSPNFGSVDYLYSKIELLAAKKRDNDTLFFSKLGFKNVKNIGTIEIEPILDIYKFIDNKPEKFEMIKLMADNGDLNKIIENPITSKNYPNHLIKFSTKKYTNEEDAILPLLTYLNDSKYFNSIKDQFVKNELNRIKANDSIVGQIDNLINKFADVSSTKTDRLFYNNENNQINDIISTKNKLISENGNIKIALINYDKIIKEVSVSTNMIAKKTARSKMKFVLPIAFVLFFVLYKLFSSFYRKQIQKRNLI